MEVYFNMFKVYKHSENRFSIKEENVKYTGNKEFILKQLINFGVEEDEIVFAFSFFDTKNHNVAHFGVNNMFTHSEIV